MVTPSLRLTFVQGPRDGDSLDYEPGSTIRVGRIVRGNEIAVKDAGISTKHLRISSVSGNWAIQDLGSSNGTLLNSIALDPDSSVDLRDGDIIKLGEYTSIVVNFVIDHVQEQKKIPPRPRRNNRRQANADRDLVGPVQVKPAGKRTRASESSNLGEISEEEKGFDVKNVNEPSSMVRKALKIENSEKLGITDGLKEEELLSEKNGNFRNVTSIQSSCVNSIKVEIEDCTMAEENSGRKAKKRVNTKATRNKKIEMEEKSVNIAAEAAEEVLKGKRITRATRSKNIEIVGDSYLELEMVLKRARKSCGKKKKAEKKLLKSFEDDEDTDVGRQDTSCPVEEDMKNEDTDVGEQGPSCPVEEDMKNELGAMVEVDLGKMTLRELFGFLEVHLPKQINLETERAIEPMRSKTQRVHEYILEQRKVQAKACVC